MIVDDFLVMGGLLAGGVAISHRRVPFGERSAARVETVGEIASTRYVALCCLVLMACFWIWTIAVERAAVTQNDPPAWLLSLPYIPIDDRYLSKAPKWIDSVAAVLCIAETLTLVLLYIVLRNRALSSPAKAIIGCCSAIMVITALRGHGLTSTDVYTYITQAHLGTQAYDPPATPFSGEFVALNRLFGTPVPPSVYGPVWLVLGNAIGKAGSTLAVQVEAFRLLGAALFAVCIALLIVLRQAAATIALFAVNPALIGQFVSDAHNDLLPIALSLGAIALARRHPALAVPLAAAAGGAKLPFVAIASLAFVEVPQRGKRIVYSAATILLAFAIIQIASTSGSGHAMRHVTQSILANTDTVTLSVHVLVACACLYIALLAIVRGRFVPGAPWSFASLGAWLYSWYAIWGLPYALLEETFAGIFLATFPVAAYRFNTFAPRTPLAILPYMLALGSPLVLFFWAARVRRRRLAVGGVRSPRTNLGPAGM